LLSRHLAIHLTPVMKQPKFIFVTGGVCSSLGKGIVASSTAAILKSGGLKVAIMKLDPYLNVDPGTMSPFQHGEVFVLEDGSETDLDLGHYERFIDTPLSGVCTVTTGRVYSEVLAEERDGKYLGGTIQVVPHITTKIKDKVKLAAKKMDVDVLVVEIGGTVGDIEAEPFLEVLRQLKNEMGKNLLSFHTTLLPYLAASKELKTKPTQLSVRELRRVGITPDVIFCRADVRIPKALLKKVAYFCDVPENCVLPAQTVRSIYEVPLRFQKHNLGDIVAEKFGLGNMKFDLADWEAGVMKMLKVKSEISIGLAGKYNELDDAYLSVIEAVKSAGFYCNKRENKVPYLGLCLGSQIMAIEFARNVLGITDATSEEFDEDKKSKNHVIHFIPEQRDIRKKGGTMRLGAYDCKIAKGTRAYEAYGADKISERHRHRYEFNDSFLGKFEGSEFIISGRHPKTNLVEIVEIKDHPFMVASQFHPEFLSRPLKPHPLFRAFMEASV